MRSIKLVLAIAVLSITGLGIIGIPQGAAYRHWSKCVHHPRDPSYACVDHNWIHVCDRQVDRHRVRAWFQIDPRWPTEATGWAPSRRCHDEGHYGNITRYRVCVEREGCSAWKNQW